MLPMILTDKVTITMPKTMVERIDNERNDVPRSVFILRLVEKAYGVDKKK